MPKVPIGSVATCDQPSAVRLTRLALMTLATLVAASEHGAPLLAEEPALARPGTLVICGGGDVPTEAIDRFVAAAGGDEAHMVVIPTAADSVGPKTFPKELEGRTFASLTTLHTTDRDEANRPEFVEPLRKASGVWFMGGQQYRIADAYLGTAVEHELMELLKREGAVGGTSAGAAIQSRVMIASGTSQPKIAKGFDLLPGTIIDQHFSQRQREQRLRSALNKHPKLLGIGIDEHTALIVAEDCAEVVGKHAVHIHDAAPQRDDGTWEVIAARSGDRFDFGERVLVPKSDDPK